MTNHTERPAFKLHLGGDQQPADTYGKRVIYRCKFVEHIHMPYPADELSWAKIAEYRIA